MSTLFFSLVFQKIYGRLLLEVIGYVNPYQCVNLYNISCILCSRWYGSTFFYFSHDVAKEETKNASS